jgi:hypothetical protein
MRVEGSATDRHGTPVDVKAIPDRRSFKNPDSSWDNLVTNVVPV